MKILLLGEYSRLHNSLKEGLVALGHEVYILGTGDLFKKYPVDFSIYPKLFSEIWFLKKFNILCFKLFKINFLKIEKGIRFYFLLPKLKKFDHIQLINSDAIETFPKFGIWLLKNLFDLNKSATKSLLVCGDETPVIDFLLKKELEYSILTPYFEDNSLKNEFEYSLKYTKKNYRNLFDWIFKNVNSVIASDIDYKIPMERMGFEINFIPNPINIKKNAFRELEISDRIIIFLGINRMNYAKKGIPFFEEALKIIKQKYAEKIEIIISEDLPYAEYIKFYDSAHILLDQVYAFDQGYNALEVMAKGKVVFTGASPEFEKQFGLKERVAINALPNVAEIEKELCYLIENQDEIRKIGERARKFIEEEHDHIKIATKYIENWKK